MSFKTASHSVLWSVIFCIPAFNLLNMKTNFRLECLQRSKPEHWVRGKIDATVQL